MTIIWLIKLDIKKKISTTITFNKYLIYLYLCPGAE